MNVNQKKGIPLYRVGSVVGLETKHPENVEASEKLKFLEN